ncbi:hypothetical protein JCM9533A_45280 [Catenuloplanes niger JCM 9533]
MARFERLSSITGLRPASQVLTWAVGAGTLNGSKTFRACDGPAPGNTGDEPTESRRVPSGPASTDQVRPACSAATCGGGLDSG